MRFVITLLIASCCYGRGPQIAGPSGTGDNPDVPNRAAPASGNVIRIARTL
jgi:hypothetical protein